MSPLDLLRTLRHTFSGNRMRAWLTLLGVMIGSGSIVMLAGLLRSGKESLNRLNQGANDAELIQVYADETPAKERTKTTRPLSARDVEVLGSSALLGAEGVGGTYEKSTRAYFGQKKKRVSIVATEPSVMSLYRLEIEKGRALDAEDLRLGRRVAVVGQEVWSELLEKRTSLEELKITIDGVSWNVVGALKNKPTMSKGRGTWMWNRKVLVPKTTFDAIFSPDHRMTELFVRLPGGEGLTERIRAARPLVSSLLLRTHLGVTNFDAKEQEGAQQEEIILMVIQMLLLGTGMLSLFVGGVNIMNIMLVTVAERTREIGIRRALGASRASIVAQFLAESATIAVVGGALGVLGGLLLLGVTVLGLRQAFGAWSFYVEGWAIALGIGLAALTGIVFGLMPALRASKLDPVEALRSA